MKIRCAYCGVSRDSRDNLMRHLRFVHGFPLSVWWLDLQCPLCGRPLSADHIGGVDKVLADHLLDDCEVYRAMEVQQVILGKVLLPYPTHRILPE